jgi:hypothetical protein
LLDKKYLYNSENTNKEFSKRVNDFFKEVNNENYKDTSNVLKLTPEESLEKFYNEIRKDNEDVNSTLSGGNKANLGIFLEKSNEKSKEMSVIFSNTGLSISNGATDTYLKELYSK